MARLFPFRPESPEVTQEPRLVNLEDTGADDVFAALSSDTARTILARLYEEPGTATDVAEAADTSLQNARYHLDKLADAGLVEEVDTWYSSRGTEMTVYGPTNEPLVVAAGREESTGVLRDALKRVLGAVGILGLASLFVDRIARSALVDAPVGGEPEYTGGDDAGGGSAGDGNGDGFHASTNDTATETPAPTEETPNIDLYLEPDRTMESMTPTSDDGETATQTEAADEAVTRTVEATREVSREVEATRQAANATESSGATATSTVEGTANAAADPGTATPVAMPDGGSLVDAAATLPPGVLFFTGGLLMIALTVGWWYTFRYRPTFA